MKSAIYLPSKSEIQITFTYDPDIINKIKSLPGRRYFNVQPMRYWTAPAIPNSIRLLKDWGFMLDKELIKLMKNDEVKEIKFSLDFTLCPLYILNGLRNINSNQGEEYANRNLQKIRRTDPANERKFQKRTAPSSEEKGDRKTEAKRKESRMDTKSIGKHENSYASTGNTEKTLRWIEKGNKEAWNKLQGCKWTGTDRDHQTCRNAIFPMWIYKGISNPDKMAGEQLQKCARCIQSRLCKSRTNVGDRNGRGCSSFCGTAEDRSEENKNFNKPWLDCNSIATLQSLVLIQGLQQGLFPFQLEDILQIEKRNGKILIASEMGLGKTAQALAWIQLHPELRPAVVVVPASLKLNWAKEAQMWMEDPKVQILSGTKGNIPIIGDIIIINYDILAGWLPKLKEIKGKVLILDEVHYTKNSGAQRTKAVKQLKKSIPHLIALSGTPIINRPVEAFNVLSMLDPSFNSFWKYAQRYCGAKHNGFGWDFTGASNTDELHKRLIDTIMIRRLKSEVLTELPDKIRSFTPVELKNEKNYRKAERDFIAYIREKKGAEAAKKAGNAEALAEIETLKQVSVAEKLPACIEWIKDFIEVDGKLVVFANHKFVIDELMKEFGSIAVKIDGSVHPDHRQGIVERFQTDDSIRLFVGNIKAAGVGLTLTAASTVAFVELPWTPGELDQAEDRCHRIGQKDAVNIHYLLAPGTIEDRIAHLLDRKRKVVGQVLDGKAEDEESMFKELMNSYNEED